MTGGEITAAAISCSMLAYGTVTIQTWRRRNGRAWMALRLTVTAEFLRSAFALWTALSVARDLPITIASVGNVLGYWTVAAAIWWLAFVMAQKEG